MGPMKCAGGWVAIQAPGAGPDSPWGRICIRAGREDMITDPRFRTNTERVKNAEACEAPIVAFIAARTLAENMEVFVRA